MTDLAQVTEHLRRHVLDGSRAFSDGYPITGTCTRPGTAERTAFENGWKRARENAIKAGMANPGADNTQHPNSR